MHPTGPGTQNVVNQPPQPKVDHPPDGPGGVDAIHDEPEGFLATPDPPIPAPPAEAEEQAGRAEPGGPGGAGRRPGE